MQTDPILRGNRWRAFYHEDGGLKAMLDDLQTAYLQRLSHVEPHNTEQLQLLAIAARIARELDSHIQAVIGGADMAQSAKDMTARIQAMPAAKRRRL